MKVHVIQDGAVVQVIGPIGPTVVTVYRGIRGDSAYEIARKAGFAGTEAEWLASLKGDKGADAQWAAGPVPPADTSLLWIKTPT